MPADNEMVIVDAGDNLIRKNLDLEPVPFLLLETEWTLALDAGQMAGGGVAGGI